MIYFNNVFTVEEIVAIFSVPGEGYSRNASFLL